MKPKNDWYYEDVYYPIHGSAHYVSGDRPHYDPVQALHEVVQEVTRGKIVPKERKIGFY